MCAGFSATIVLITTGLNHQQIINDDKHTVNAFKFVLATDYPAGLLIFVFYFEALNQSILF